MDKIKTKLVVALGASIGISIYLIKCYDKKIKNEEDIEVFFPHKKSLYEKYLKRKFDIICSLLAILCFGWLYIIVAIFVKAKLGSPVLFIQSRPGLINPKTGKETIFNMYKFRSMTDERDKNGELLSDEKRLTSFGKALRKTSLDELPEVFNILKGDMSIIGPRPQLIKDMVFMTYEQRKRHSVRPGLSGLAQINGRNDIDWEDKIAWDLKYINKITFLGDMKIIFQTVMKAFVKQEGITESDMATAEDFGTYLLNKGKISREEYDRKQAEVSEALVDKKTLQRKKDLVSIIMPSYNTAPYIKQTIQTVLNQTYTNWELIIVDDCSLDNTDLILKEIEDERIRIFKNKKNSGAAISRNKGLREARGQWIAFLDSDDLWHPKKLEKQIAFMKSHGYAFTYTNYEEIDVNGCRTGIEVTGPKKITQTGMFHYCWPGCLTVMYDAEKIGLIQISDIKKNNDYAMWLKVCRKADCYLLDECLAQYRKGRAGSVSTQHIKTLIEWHYRLFKDVENQGILLSVFNTMRNMFFGSIKKYMFCSLKKK